MSLCYCTDPDCPCLTDTRGRMTRAWQDDPDCPWQDAPLRRASAARAWQMIAWAAGFALRWREIAPERFR